MLAYRRLGDLSDSCKLVFLYTGHTHATPVDQTSHSTSKRVGGLVSPTVVRGLEQPATNGK